MTDKATLEHQLAEARERRVRAERKLEEAALEYAEAFEAVALAVKAVERADDGAAVAWGAAGMAWWNGLTDADRDHWLAVAGSDVIADAWAAYKRRDPTPDEAAGMAWWNGITEDERAHWLTVTGRAVVADAWAAFKRSQTQS